MARAVGPTLPRWRLGEELYRLRRAAGLSDRDVADKLGAYPSKVRKIESGKVGFTRADLTVMLMAYGLGEDDPAANRLYELLGLGKARGWWSESYGALPPKFAEFLELEGSATRIRSYEPLVIHGLAQTEEYARAIATHSSGPVDADEVERQVQLKMERQKHVLDGERPELSILIHAAAVRQTIGGADVMADQLTYLESMVGVVGLRVVPDNVGAHPGHLGTLTIFDFDPSLHSPVAYAETHVGPMWSEAAEAVERCAGLYDDVLAVALDADATAEYVGRCKQELRGTAT